MCPPAPWLWKHDVGEFFVCNLDCVTVVIPVGVSFFLLLHKTLTVLLNFEKCREEDRISRAEAECADLVPFFPVVSFLIVTPADSAASSDMQHDAELLFCL